MGHLAHGGAAPVDVAPLQTAILDIESVAKDLVEGVEALGQQALELADSTEKARVETLKQSDQKIVSLEQQTRDMATLVESSSERTAVLEAANEELDAFSYSVSHDLRAPLRAIEGFARILSEEHCAAMTEEGKQCVEMVIGHAGKMRQLIEGLLAFSRLGLQTPVKTTVYPGEIVRACLNEMTVEEQGRSVEFVIGDMPSCKADPVLLKQVWTNLLSNALKYTRNKKSARIEIGSRTEQRSPTDARSDVIYFVKDNGVGFDMKHADKLFAVFQRLHKAADFEGTGAGLAISQRIIQRHGGQIWGEAKPNQGATFSFTLG